MLLTYDGSELVVEVVGGDEMESLKKSLDAARVTKAMAKSMTRAQKRAQTRAQTRAKTRAQTRAQTKAIKPKAIKKGWDNGYDIGYDKDDDKGAGDVGDDVNAHLGLAQVLSVRKWVGHRAATKVKTNTGLSIRWLCKATHNSYPIGF